MPKSDNKYFNCSEPYEVNYVVNLYSSSDRDSVRALIEENCNSGYINNWTHDQLYAFLSSRGYHKD